MKNEAYEDLQKTVETLQDELESTKKIFDIILDSVNDIVYIIDPDSNIVEVNKKVEDYGYNVEELRGKPVLDFIPDKYKEVARQVVIERREKIKEVKNGRRKQYHQVVEMPFIDKKKRVRELQIYGGSFIANFKVTTVRVHKGEPIKKNHIYTVGIARDLTKQKALEREKEQLIADLEKSLAEIKKLSGMLPICAACKKIRDDEGYWQHLEGYIEAHSEALFTHCICPECADNLYKNTKWHKKKQLKGDS